MLCDTADAEGGAGGAVDAVACNRLLHALGRGENRGREQHARKLLELMASGRLGPGARPDVVSYTSALDALGRAGDLDGAAALLHEMEARGDPAPNVRTYTAVMRDAARAGQWERCLALLEGVAERGMRVRRGGVGAIHPFS